MWQAGGLSSRPVIIPANATDLDERKNILAGALVWPFNPAPDSSPPPARATRATMPARITAIPAAMPSRAMARSSQRRL